MAHAAWAQWMGWGRYRGQLLGRQQGQQQQWQRQQQTN